MSVPHAGLTHLDQPTSFEDSNIALLGSDKEGVWAWRVEEFKVVLVKQGDELGDGGFYDGDSYVVLKSVAPVKSKPHELIHDIHFWLGRNTTQDEAGVAAYKTVELDEFLACSPTQHRQLQSFESSSFLSLFHPHFVVRKGGVKSGFHHVEQEKGRLDKARLWEVSGDRHVKVVEVDVGKERLRKGNVYVLDWGDELMQWNGGEAHPMEKAKAAETARRWADQRGGHTTLRVFDDGQGDTSFFLALGVPANELPLRIPSAPKAPLTASTVSSPLTILDLITTPPTPLPSFLPLATSLILIINPPTSSSPHYIWVGSEVLEADRRAAMSLAMRAVVETGVAVGKAIAVVKAGREGKEFLGLVGRK
ncbi:hypothetical protein MNV49_002680 [Pseudohyphozyma bogoriensis]|nr:hypothetical protein MNV49_002680 [Pseudohyphozyma bogoriensis]